MKQKKNYRIILAAVLLLFCLGHVTEAKDYNVVVSLKDGSSVKGILLQLTEEGVKIDPEGAVSFRSIADEEIDSVYVEKLDRTLLYPLSAGEIPPELSGLNSKVRVSMGRTLPRETSGFRTFALTLTGGIVTTGPGDKEYYEGFTTGPTYQVGLRFNIPEDDPHSNRIFLGLLYHYSSIHAEDESILMGWDEFGVPIYMVFDPLHVQNIGFEIGATTNTIGTDSYLYGLIGLSFLKHTLTARAEYDGTTLASTTVNDSQTGIRLGGGGVIGLSSRTGIEIKVAWDLLLSRSSSNYYYYGQTSPESNGGLLSLTVGLCFDL